MKHKTQHAAFFAIVSFVALVGLIPLVRPAAAYHADTPMVAAFRDGSGGTIPDAIKSDGGGAYTNGAQNIEAIIDGVGDFDFDTSASGSQVIRSVCLDFTNPASSGANPPFATGCVDLFLSTGGGSSLLQMAVGTSQGKHVHISFAGYTLDFNPNAQPGSTTVTVTRTSATTWTIEADYPNAIAQLTKLSTAKGKSISTNEGLFNMPFEITIQTK